MSNPKYFWRAHFSLVSRASPPAPLILAEYRDNDVSWQLAQNTQHQKPVERTGEDQERNRICGRKEVGHLMYVLPAKGQASTNFPDSLP
jgi:hypothetical protein